VSSAIAITHGAIKKGRGEVISLALYHARGRGRGGRIKLKCRSIPHWRKKGGREMNCYVGSGNGKRKTAAGSRPFQGEKAKKS